MAGPVALYDPVRAAVDQHLRAVREHVIEAGIQLHALCRGCGVVDGHPGGADHRRPLAEGLGVVDSHARSGGLGRERAPRLVQEDVRYRIGLSRVRVARNVVDRRLRATDVDAQPVRRERGEPVGGEGGPGLIRRELGGGVLRADFFFFFFFYFFFFFFFFFFPPPPPPPPPPPSLEDGR